MATAKYINFNQALPIGENSGILSRIKSAGSSLNNTTLMIIVAVILFAVLAGFYYFYYIAPQFKAKYQPNSEHVDVGSNDGKNAELLFFFAEWCPHCKTAKPVWNDMKSEYDGTVINGYKISFVEYNCTKETPENQSLMDKYKIEGFPSIILNKDNQIIDFDAKPSKATMEQFLNTVL